MQVNSAKPQRRSIRLKDYDYSQPGSYFITICTHGHQNLFGDIVTVRAGSEPARTEATRTEPAKMILNPYGEIILFTWNDLVNHNTGIKLGEFVIMPNHFHGIIHIIDPDTEWEDFIPSEFLFHNAGDDLVRAGSEPARTELSRTEATSREPTRTEPILENQIKQTPLSEIVRQFKTFSARRINQLRNTPGVPAWHRDYYEHIIRNQESYNQIVEYIQNNPMMWNLDKLYVD